MNKQRLLSKFLWLLIFTGSMFLASCKKDEAPLLAPEMQMSVENSKISLNFEETLLLEAAPLNNADYQQEWKVDGQAPSLKDSGQIEAAMAEVNEKYGRLDVLVNNAGISAREKLYDYKEEEFEKILDLNVSSVFRCAKAAAPIMKDQGGGAILNTSSMVSIYGQPSGVGYPASKFAVNGITKSLARELGKDGIRVNAVAPGIIRTEMMEAVPKEMIEPLIRSIPLGRIGEPEDIANAFVFLASDMASYITGTILQVDGAAMN